MKKWIGIIFIFGLILALIGCGSDESKKIQTEEKTDEASSDVWDIKEMPFSDIVKEVFPEEKYNLVAVDINGINITDEFMKYLMSVMPSKMDPKIVFENFKVYEVQAVRKKEDPNIVYFILNREKDITVGDFLKAPVEMKGIDESDMVEYTPEETISIVKRK